MGAAAEGGNPVSRSDLVPKRRWTPRTAYVSIGGSDVEVLAQLQAAANRVDARLIDSMREDLYVGRKVRPTWFQRLKRWIGRWT